MSYVDGSLAWVEWSCLACRRAVRTTEYWAQTYECDHKSSGQLPWMSDPKAHAELLKKLGKPQPRRNYNPMNITEIDLYSELMKLDEDALESVVRKFDAFKWQDRNKAAQKARDFAYQAVPGWASSCNAAVNGVLRAVRRTGRQWDHVKAMTLMAAAENAVLAQFAKEQLTEAELTMLWSPVAEEIEQVLGTELKPSAFIPTTGRDAKEGKKSSRKRAQEPAAVAQEPAPVSGAEAQEFAALLGVSAPQVAPAEVAALDEFEALLAEASEPAPQVPVVAELDQQMREVLVSRTDISSSVEDDLDALLEGVA